MAVPLPKDKYRNPAGGNKPASVRARHGYRSEVSWDHGAGHQPYGNQGPHETPGPGLGEQADGNRRERSGRTLDQFEQVRQKP